MAGNDTIIVVGTTELDSYGNLLVTPSGGGEKVKIGAKRESLHPLFEQGKAILLHWETYNNRPYVARAKLVEGELPPPKEVKTQPVPHTEITGQTIGMTTKEIGDMIRAVKLKPIFGKEATIELVKWYRGQILGNTRVSYDGAKLPDLEKVIIDKKEE